VKNLFQNKLKVYLVLGLLGLVGIISGLNLSVSLFPNISRPTVGLWMNYVNIEKSDFIEDHGYKLENELDTLRNGKTKIERVFAEYNDDGVFMRILFDWGTDPEDAYREVRAITNQWQNGLPKETADTLGVWQWNENTGYLSISFFSNTKTIDELYQHLDPILSPGLDAANQFEEALLFNPKKKEVRIELDPYKMSELGIYPRDIQQMLNENLKSYIGGSIRSGDNKLQLNLVSNEKSIEGIKNIRLYKDTKSFLLNEIAKIYIAPHSSRKRVFKTDGKESLILWAKPKVGANVKEATESIIQLIKDKEAQFDKDVQYKILVDPSEFIRSSISNVFKSVVIASCLAVIVLFLFMGSFRNVSSAFIEIPFSIILAFILMELFDMNLNLISLGGMALAAGMNVDASIVVLENIIRHFSMQKEKTNQDFSYAYKCEVILRALKEVWRPILVSTVTTLIVFTPLIFTKDLTNAVLGDLAKAVIFSHGFACMIALIVVPLVRTQIITRESLHTQALLDKPLSKFQTLYQRTLYFFISKKKARLALFSSIPIALILLFTFVLPQVPKELIGKPNTDWIILSVNSSTSKSIKDIERVIQKAELKINKEFGAEINYNFMQIRRENRGNLMLRLHDKSKMEDFKERLTKAFPNTPEVRYSVHPWNPAELPLPDYPDVEVQIKGKDTELLATTAQSILTTIKEEKIDDNMWSEPGLKKNEKYLILPYESVWRKIKENGVTLQESDILDISMLADSGKKISEIYQKSVSTDIVLKFPDKYNLSESTLAAFPLRVKDKIVPLNALFDLKKAQASPPTIRENGENIVFFRSRLPQDKKDQKEEIKEKIATLLKQEKKKTTGISMEVVDENRDLTKALGQLYQSILISFVLIAFVLMLQFGNLANVLTVLLAIPLGLVGVIIALFIFDSTLSLNSALGVILLNGIAVNNSILLVDFANREYAKGKDAMNAVLDAATQRLRPILITSLTSILGMLPIAFGMGEGGEILQPLGITVTCGLWVSTLLTIVFIPLVQYLVLKHKDSKKPLMTNNTNTIIPTENESEMGAFH
jgi:HAE1 family hydrophobic/amphiphilic exporter-1